jgi:hypothetical protein
MVTATKKKATTHKKATAHKTAWHPRKWSANVTKHSNALDLKQNIFESHDPKEIAQSLKSSAVKSHRRKSSPYRSAMSMLTFYINRAGKNLPKKQKNVLEKAKNELRVAFGREELQK